MTDNEIIQHYKKYEPIFGSWYIKRFIGEGGFAKVFEIVRTDFGAEYTSALKIITVSKTKSEINTLRSEGMTDDDIRGYLRGIVEDTVKEIQLMYKLRGKGNIVSYEDHVVVEHEDGMGWDILIKMEFLTSISTYITANKGRLLKQDIIRLGVDICKALEYCQRYNIIHRDIKADNIFITDDGEFKLGDFGIARVIERKDQTLSKKGTSAYMAPEVYKGQTYTSAVDIYSLGMVMYRLLNNNRGPFLPPYPQQMSLDDRDHAMMLRMSGERFPKPNQVNRGRLAEIVLKACAYRPEERYSSPGFMRQELEAILLDREEVADDEWVVIYDAQGRSTTSSPTSGQSSLHATGSAYSPVGSSGFSSALQVQEERGVAEILQSDSATEVLREDDVTEVLRSDDATEVLRPDDATEVLRADDAIKILQADGATEVLREEGSAAASWVNPDSAFKIPCIKCGSLIDRTAAFCSFCGANQKEEQHHEETTPQPIQPAPPAIEAEDFQPIQPAARTENIQPAQPAAKTENTQPAQSVAKTENTQPAQPAARSENSQPPVRTTPANENREEKVYCKKCGSVIRSGMTFCLVCGLGQVDKRRFVSDSGYQLYVDETEPEKETDEETKRAYCKECGAAIRSGMTFCLVCGVSQEEEEEDKPKKILTRENLEKLSKVNQQVLSRLKGKLKWDDSGDEEDEEPAEQSYCRECGGVLGKNVKTCFICGTRQ